MAKKTKKPKSTPKQPTLPEKPKDIKAVATTRAETFSGPLPPPQILEQYNQIISGAADRIIAMAESQSQHRQGIENKVIEADIKSARLGLHYGLIIGLAAIVGGAICILMGREVGGSIIGGTGITGLVGVFVYGSTQRRKEREMRFRKITDTK